MGAVGPRLTRAGHASGVSGVAQRESTQGQQNEMADAEMGHSSVSGGSRRRVGGARACTAQQAALVSGMQLACPCRPGTQPRWPPPSQPARQQHLRPCSCRAHRRRHPRRTACQAGLPQNGKTPPSTPGAPAGSAPPGWAAPSTWLPRRRARPLRQEGRAGWGAWQRFCKPSNSPRQPVQGAASNKAPRRPSPSGTHCTHRWVHALAPVGKRRYVHCAMLASLPLQRRAATQMGAPSNSAREVLYPASWPAGRPCPRQTT